MSILSLSLPAKDKEALFSVTLSLKSLFCSKTFVFFLIHIFFLNCNCVLLSLLIRKYLHLTSCQDIFLYFWYFIVHVTVILQLCHYFCHIFTVDVQHSYDCYHRYKRILYQICLRSLRSLTGESKRNYTCLQLFPDCLCLFNRVKEPFSDPYIPMDVY